MHVNTKLAELHWAANEWKQGRKFANLARKIMKLIPLAILLILATGVYGEDSSEEDVIDLFEDSDQVTTIEEGLPEVEKDSVFEQVITNWGGESNFRYFLYFERLDAGGVELPDDKRHIFESESKHNSHFGTDDWRVSFGLIHSFGNQEDTYIPAFENLEEREWQDWLRDSRRERRYLSIKELYLSIFFDNFDLFIGRKLLTNTLSTIYGPADIYNAVDANSPFYSSTLGKYLFELDYYVGDFSITAAIFPIYQGGKSFGPFSRWGYYSTIELEAVTGVPIDQLVEDYPDINWENISYFLRLKANLPRIDLFFSGFYGLNGNQVMKSDVPASTWRKEIVPVVNAAASFSTTLSKLELHGEALYNYTPKSKDDDYLRFVTGGRYAFDELDKVSFLDKVDLKFEYAGEYLIKEQSNENFDFSSEDTRALKNDLLGSIEFDFTKDFAAYFTGQYDIEGQGISLLSEIEYSGLENFQLNLKLQLFYADESCDLFHWRDNNRIITAVRYSF